MKRLAMVMVAALALLAIPVAPQAQAAEAPLAPAIGKTPGNGNPLFSHKFGADPYALEYDGRIYIYMTNDILEYNADGTVRDNTYGRINKITVVSSDDLVNWTDHGEIPVAGAQGATKWANNSWAPAAAHKKINGQDKFFLYFADSANGIGVLTADSPIGPFVDPLGKALISRSGTPGVADVTWLFDPAVLVDDDGSAYIYFGGGVPAGKESDPGTARVAKLGDDMISLDLAASGGAAKPINPPWLFEDSGINKYNGKYYYSYCTNFSSGNRPDHPAGTIAYMVSDNPLGPFTYVKTILPNPSVFFGVGGNNHHAIFDFKGESYIVYHAQTLAKAMAESGTMPEMGGQAHGYRNAHINKLTFDENGVIENITGDYKGPTQLRNFNPYARVEAEAFAWNGGISTEPTTEPGALVSGLNLAVSKIQDGDWTALSKVDFGQKGAGTFTANVASGGNGGTIELRLDSATGPLIGTLPVSHTGGDNNWQKKTTAITGATGVHDLYMVYRGAAGSELFKVDYWQFEERGETRELAAINASIDKHKLDIAGGTNKAALQVKAIYTDGTTEDVTSAASATPGQNGIVSVEGGIVTGVGYGSTSVSISYGGKSDTIHLLVKDLNSELTVKQITVDNAAVALEAGRSATFKVTAEYMDGRLADVTRLATYSNPSPDVAEVSNGTITAKGSGSTEVTVSYRGELGEAAKATIRVTVDKPAFVAIEAETAADNTENAYVTGVIDGHSWTLVDGQSTKAMLFGPDTGFNMTGTDAATLATGSRLSYKINFQTAGTYHVWILAKSVDYNSDSVHVGLNNEYRFTVNGIQGVSNGQFNWANLSNGGTVVTGGTTLNITAGVHELNFWGREDGLVIDRIYLTTSTSTANPIWPPAEPQGPGAVLTAESSVKPGSTFQVGVGLQHVPQDVYAQDVTLSYNSDVFEYVSAAGATDNIRVVAENNETSGEVRLVTASIGGASVEQALLNVTFRVKAGVSNTSGSIAVTRAELGTGLDGTVIEARGSSKTIAVGSPDVVVDKTTLTEAIASAQGLADAAVVGTKPGQYPQAAVDALKEAIATATAVKDAAGATQTQVNAAVDALHAAVETFKAAVVKQASEDLNGDGKISVGDLAMVAYHYGKDTASADWDTAKVADLNGDGKVDIEDLSRVAAMIFLETAADSK